MQGFSNAYRLRLAFRDEKGRIALLPIDGEVVFPPDSTRVVSQGNWRVAPKVVFWAKGGITLREEYGGKPSRPPRRLPGRRRRQR